MIGTSRRKQSPGAPAYGLVGGLCILLAGSTALRVVTGADAALATDARLPAAVEDRDAGEELRDPPMALLAALQEREALLDAREAALADRIQALAVTERKVEAMIEELVAAEARLSDTLARADQASERDLDQLTSVYERMEPEEAAALFEQMIPDFAAGFLSRMRPEAAAGVMAHLAPETAHTVSVVLAGRNARVPRN